MAYLPINIQVAPAVLVLRSRMSIDDIARQRHMLAVVAESSQERAGDQGSCDRGTNENELRTVHRGLGDVDGQSHSIASYFTPISRRSCKQHALFYTSMLPHYGQVSVLRFTHCSLLSFMPSPPSPATPSLKTASPNTLLLLIW